MVGLGGRLLVGDLSLFLRNNRSISSICGSGLGHIMVRLLSGMGGAIVIDGGSRAVGWVGGVGSAYDLGERSCGVLVGELDRNSAMRSWVDGEEGL